MIEKTFHWGNDGDFSTLVAGVVSNTSPETAASGSFSNSSGEVLFMVMEFLVSLARETG